MDDQLQSCCLGMHVTFSTLTDKLRDNPLLSEPSDLDSIKATYKHLRGQIVTSHACITHFRQTRDTFWGPLSLCRRPQPHQLA